MKSIIKKSFTVLLILTFLVSCSPTKEQTSSESSSDYNSTSSDNGDSLESSSVSAIISSSETSSNSTSESGGSSMTSKINNSSSKSSSSRYTSSVQEVFTGKTYTIDFEKYYTQNASNFNRAFNSALNEIKLISAKHKADGSDYRITIDVKKREYTLSSSINFANVSNIIFKGNGSSFIFNKVVGAFEFNKATNITLQDLTIDYNPLHFTQGVITKIEENGKVIEVEVDKGYPVDADILNQLGCIAIFVDAKTGAFRANTRDSMAASSVTKIGDNKLRLNIGWAVTEKINSSSAII